MYLSTSDNADHILFRNNYCCLNDAKLAFPWTNVMAG